MKVDERYFCFGCGATGDVIEFEEKIGFIKERYNADIIGINIMQSHLFTTQNIIHTITESDCGLDVTHSIIGGKVLMKDKEVLTLDKEKIMYDCVKFQENYPELACWK